MREMTTEPTKIRDLAPVSVRLVPELRHALAREAAIHGRSLHGEIVQRLKQSLADEASSGERLMEPTPTYQRAGAEPTLNSSEQWLVSVFRGLPPDKQLALLSLLK
jgi:hypothetical protein